MSIRLNSAGRVITKSGKVSCECCDDPTNPPAPPQQCLSAVRNFDTSIWPPPEGFQTVASYFTTYHINHEQFLYYTETPATVRETLSSFYQFDLTAPLTNGNGASVILQRLVNTGLQERTYESPPTAFPQVWPPTPPPTLNFSRCGFEATNVGWPELGSPSGYFRVGLSQDGIYGNCNLALGGGLDNGPQFGTVTTSSVVFIEDDRPDVSNSNRTHLMLIRLIILVDDARVDLLNPYGNPFNYPMFSVRIRLLYTQYAATSRPLPNQAPSTITAQSFGKQIPLYPFFEFVPAQTRPFENQCILLVNSYNWSNVQFSANYNLEFVPNPP